MTRPDARWLQVFGWSHSGKTRVVAAVIRRLTADGRRVLAVKHSHHGGPPDGGARTGDTAVFRAAGAAAALLLARDGAWRDEGPPSGLRRLPAASWPVHLAQGIEDICPDWVVVEGGHRWATPKVALAGAGGLKPGAAPILAALCVDPDNPQRDPEATAAWLLGHADRVSRELRDVRLEEGGEPGTPAGGPA
jgi:molybdopterin-guanine dinucleotide biosynthesis protein B